MQTYLRKNPQQGQGWAFPLFLLHLMPSLWLFSSSVAVRGVSSAFLVISTPLVFDDVFSFTQSRAGDVY
ncbi:MAG: hypothetical protein QW594_00425 [Candidatus Woesearchaeota archaeon]